jgi:DNA-binding winged helix-turn-helix (wHTH) protein
VQEAAHSPFVVRFDSFEVNLRSGEVRRNGDKLKLPEQSFQILGMLLEQAGELVMRKDIQKRLWPNDTVVEFENSINAGIKKLRLALGDSADEPRYIETLARRGYRWMTTCRVGKLHSSGTAARAIQRCGVPFSVRGLVHEREESIPLSRAGNTRWRRHGSCV